LRVREFAAALALGMAALAVGDEAKNAANPAQDPFYRKYLVPGNPLDDQILAMEKRIEARPDDATLRNDFGNLLALRKFYEQAADQYQMAAKLDPSNFISYYNLGLVRETEGKASDAISAYKKSIARKPGFPPSRFRLGRLYEHTGKVDDAVAQYAKALRIDPSMRDPRRNPLVIDSELMYRASLANYERDVARVTLDRDASFVEEPSFRRVPVDRAVAAAEVAGSEAPEPTPREVGPGTGAPASEGTTRQPRPTPPPDSSLRPGPGSAGRPVRGVRPAPPAKPPAVGPPVSAPPPTPAVAPEEPIEPSTPEDVPEPEPTPQVLEELEPS
jgi:hypothetical protein